MASPTIAIAAEKPVAAPLPRRRLDYVDALRGLSCIWVVLHHALGGILPANGHYSTLERVSNAFFNLGWLGVSMFLVLSAFCLYHPLIRKNEVSDVSMNTREFAKRRARRILPPYYAALAISCVARLLEAHLKHQPLFSQFAGAKDIVLHVLLLQNLNAQTLPSINTPMWSISLEAELYVVFPLLVLLAATKGLRVVLGVTFAVSVIWQSIVFHYLGFAHNWPSVFALWYYAMPGRVFEYAAGMLAAALVARPVKHQSRISLAVIVALIVPGVYYAVVVSRFGPLLDQMWGVLFAAVLILLSRISNSVFESRFLPKALVWVGTISYSIYLMHQPILTLSERFLEAHAHGIGSVARKIIEIALTIIVGYIFHLLFERPFMTAPPTVKLTGSGDAKAAVTA